jgi:hypothetical protein
MSLYGTSKPPLNYVHVLQLIVTVLYMGAYGLGRVVSSPIHGLLEIDENRKNLDNISHVLLLFALQPLCALAAF